jgi:hypothetical protein
MCLTGTNWKEFQSRGLVASATTLLPKRILAMNCRHAALLAIGYIHANLNAQRRRGLSMRTAAATESRSVEVLTQYYHFN